MLLVYFYMITVFLCLMFYMSLDPLKSGFFLILSLITLSPLISMGYHVWYSYFICMIFLSGIFVILVYFSSLSSVIMLKFPFIIFLLLMFFFLSEETSYFFVENLGFHEFYYEINQLMMVFIIMFFLLFMNFLSYFLHLGSALRKF